MLVFLVDLILSDVLSLSVLLNLSKKSPNFLTVFTNPLLSVLTLLLSGSLSLSVLLNFWVNSCCIAPPAPYDISLPVILLNKLVPVLDIL